MVEAESKGRKHNCVKWCERPVMKCWEGQKLIERHIRRQGGRAKRWGSHCERKWTFKKGQKFKMNSDRGTQKVAKRTRAKARHEGTQWLQNRHSRTYGYRRLLRDTRNNSMNCKNVKNERELMTWLSWWKVSTSCKKGCWIGNEFGKVFFTKDEL